MTVLFVNSTGVSGLTDATANLVAKVAANAGDDADAGFFLRVKRRTLLNVQFSESGDLGKINARFGLYHIFRVKTGFLDGFCQRLILRTMLESQIFAGQLTGHGQ